MVRDGSRFSDRQHPTLTFFSSSVPSPPPAHRYEEVSDLAKLTQLLEEYLDEYNLVNTNPLNLGECDKGGIRLMMRPG